MINFKDNYNKIRGSELVQNTLSKIKPTWNVAKKGSALMVLIISVVLTYFFSFSYKVIDFIGDKLLDLPYVNLTSTYFLSNFIKNIFEYDSSFLFTLLGFMLIWVVISILCFIIVNIFVQNATVRSLISIGRDEKEVSFGDYFRNAFTGVWEYTKNYLIIVFLPILIIEIAGAIIGIIPFIRGENISYYIVNIFKYALLFKLYAKMLNLDMEESVTKYWSYWLSYSIFAYVIRIITSFSPIRVFLELMFILYSVLILTKSKHYCESLEGN